jgi:MFS family permease
MSARPSHSSSSNELPGHILPIIVGAQFTGTSLWFAGNAVVGSLVRELGLSASILSSLTSAVQLGFILGTLVFAFASLADRVPARLLFLICSLAGATSTALVPHLATGESSLLALRFATGFFLAGVYPVGMKIAAAWFGKDLGRALGYLVGALVLGTAFPYAVRAWVGDLDYRGVLFTVATLAALGGIVLYLFVPEGPFTKKGARFDATILFKMFGYERFRAAALGYFGHMWELYAFWAFVPWTVARCQERDPWGMSVPAASFSVIAVGALGCAVGGLQSLRIGGARVAAGNLSISGLCCLASPLLFFLPAPAAILFLAVWGWTVVADSAQFSSLAAAGAPPEYVGSALTLMNCIGFSVTIATVQILGVATSSGPPHLALLWLAPGPAFGLWAMRGLKRAV